MNSFFNTIKKCCLLPAILLALAAFDSNLLAQDCCSQGGKPVALTMKYVGGNCSSSNDSQEDKSNCHNFNGGLGTPASVYVVVSEKSDGSGKKYFTGTVALNASFSASAITAGEDKFPSKIFFRILTSQGGALVQRNEIHTSCSAPIVPGGQVC